MQTLDSIIKVLTAAKEGKEIEFTSRYEDDEWSSVKNPEKYDYDFINYTYRIKPTKVYRPYKNAEEFTDALSKHVSIMNKVDEIYYCPISYDDETITICYMDGGITQYEKISFETIKDYYEWDNGDVCGVLMEE